MLIYAHGFNSSPRSFKANLLHERMQAIGPGEQFTCPALPHRPAQAIRLLEDTLRAAQAAGDTNITVVGSSLGGYYATYLAQRHGVRAVLLNPAIVPAQDLRAYLGAQQNLYTGERYELTEQHLNELAALEVARIERPELFFLLTETGDELLDYRLGVAKYRGAKQLVIQGGDHAFNDFAKYADQVLEFARVRVPAA